MAYSKRPEMKQSFGNRHLIGQAEAREQLRRELSSDRMSHAYLFSGPRGVGKTAFALAFAEALNGISNLTDLEEGTSSKKSSWFTHPDIQLFIPLPSHVTRNASLRSKEMKTRLSLLWQNPYEIVDFRFRPVIDDDRSSKNLQAFYPINYFRDEIRPQSFFTPNEGRYNIVILTDIDTMRAETANTFLKLLEEPPEDVIFLLTTTAPEQVLPTLLSRCRQIRLHPLSEEEVTEALVTRDGMDPKNASWLARISGGNYALTRHYDVERLQKTRGELIDFLRNAYIGDAETLQESVQEWQKQLNTENQIALCNSLELLLRDLMIWRETEQKELLINIDQLEVISKFCKSLQNARLMEMIEQLQNLKGYLYQNVQFKLIFTVLSFRFAALMRGRTPVIADDADWQHLPALI